MSASGSSDGVGSGVAHYQYRVSPDNGVTWGATTSGSSVKLATRGVYVVQFQAVDNVGLLSAWAPASAGHGEHGLYPLTPRRRRMTVDGSRPAAAPISRSE